MAEPDLLVALPPQAEDLVQLVDPILVGLLDISYKICCTMSPKEMISGY